MKHFLLFTTTILLLNIFSACKRISKNWSYDAQTNNLTSEINPSGTVLMLEFEEYINTFTPHRDLCQANLMSFIEENDSLGVETAMKNYFEKELVDEIDTNGKFGKEKSSKSALENFSLIDDLHHNKDIKVNGKPYNGRIIGYHKVSGKKVFEFNPGNSNIRHLPGEKIADDDGLIPKKCTLWTETGERKIEETYMIDINMETRKPVIYLYPKKEQQVDIQIDIEHGSLTTTYPKYKENKGWSVIAKPDGTLIDPSTQKEYYALYWEANSRYHYDMSKGFVVKGTDCAEFLEEKLAEIGLNHREANEFIIYWLPILEGNKYNLIHFSTDEYAAENRMNISPKPETLIRLLMVYSPLDNPIKIEPQQFSPIQRKGFTVIEWGGQAQHYKLQ